MALIKCSSCGQMISDKAKNCPKCGTPVEIPLKCEECGESVSPHSVSCPNCGAPFKSPMTQCEECGESIPPHSASCPNCGAPFKSSMIQCEKCEEMIPNDSVFCTHCGRPIKSTINHKSNISTSKLKILWKGKYAATQCSVKILINNEFIGEYSYNNGFCIEVPITSSEMSIGVVCNKIKREFRFQLSHNIDYTCNLIMPNGLSAIAGFSYELSDSNGNVRKDTDKLGIGMIILTFLVPLIGIIYYFMKKTEFPVKAKTALFCGLTATVIYLLLSYNN